MNKVYKHKPFSPDEYLGRVDAEGKVYEARLGLDRLIGRLDLGSGRIYETHLGPDRYIGRVELDSGKVFFAKMGPDEYFGRVHDDGKLYHHKRLSPDEYLGRVKDMTSFGHGGAAFLLLVAPIYEDEVRQAAEAAQAKEERASEEPGEGAAPAEA